MLATKCPGQDMRYWTAEDVHEEECPQCGALIEFFKTDIRLRCPSCRTRVANPRFDMGCAQWCAYAEQCLGPGARGLQGKSLRAILESELDRLGKAVPDKVEKVKALINEAEATCEKERLDLFPVIAALVLNFLHAEGLIEDRGAFLDKLKSDHTLPQQALKDTANLLETLGTGNKESRMEVVVADLLGRLNGG